MKLELHNILKLEQANLEFGGLTVLIGENDSGKSTVGKILFALLKAANTALHVDRLSTAEAIESDHLNIIRLFLGTPYFQTLMSTKQNEGINLLEHNPPIDFFINEILSYARKAHFSSRKISILLGALEQIRERIKEANDPPLAIKNEFIRVARSEFMESLNSFGVSHSSIQFDDDSLPEACHIEITLCNGKVSGAIMGGVPSINDITYVESPLYLHILNSLRLSTLLPIVGNRSNPSHYSAKVVPAHLADMTEKILSSMNTANISKHYLENGRGYSKLLKKLLSTIDGEFVVDDVKNFFFSKKGKKIPPISVASGIKAFGLLQRLIQTDNVSPYKMLVWDEPENHLHPEWQIVLCQLLVELVTQGVPILVSSHSPYLVQGLRYYASAFGIEKDVKYYTPTKSSTSQFNHIDEVTGDLNRVFTSLAVPLRDIMNVDKDRGKFCENI